MSKTTCPNCGNPKKPWFNLCFDCNEKEKQKPTCEVCGEEVPEGHTLCKQHWKEKQEQKKKLKQIDYVKGKKETDFREKFQGKFSLFKKCTTQSIAFLKGKIKLISTRKDIKAKIEIHIVFSVKEVKRLALTGLS